MNTKPTLRLLPVLALLCGACGDKNEFMAPPPPPVTVAAPAVRDVTVYKTFPGTLEAIASVEVRARVRGVLEKVHFDDGQLVEKGAPLFLIEQAPYKAALQAAEANLAQAEAALQLASATLTRLEKAAATNAVSKTDVEVARAEQAGAQAGVRQAGATVEDARINLSYTEVKAPVAGRASRSLVDEGNLVDGSQATLLTTIVDDSTIRAYFELNERDLLPFLERRPQPGKEGDVKVRGTLELQLELTDGSVYGPTGRIDFVDNQVDASTRTIRARAKFPNPDGKLAAGLFGRVGIPNSIEKAVLIPSLAIQRDLGGEYVWVVGEGDVVSRRGITPAAIVGRERIITDGLDGSERVIVSGLQRAREGAKVTPQSAPTSGEGAAKPDKPAPGASDEGKKAE